MPFVKRYGTFVFLQYPKIPDVKAGCRKIKQLPTDTLPGKKGIYIQLNDFPFMNANDSLHEIIFKNPHFPQLFRVSLQFLSNRQYLKLSKRIQVIMENSAVVHPFRKDKNFSNPRNISVFSLSDHFILIFN